MIITQVYTQRLREVLSWLMNLKLLGVSRSLLYCPW